MNALGEKIAGLIRQTGPIPVGDYMAMCLFDPEHGYYTTRQPFGAAGDFTTAPEVSQMFGELVAVWLYSAWRLADIADRATIVEIGPGRGTLMADVIRTLRRLDPAFLAAAQIAMVEASPRLTEVQRRTLADAGAKVAWYGSFRDVPAGPLLVVGNEIFDALPLRQFVKSGDHWLERHVGLDANGGAFRFVAGAGTLDAGLLPASAGIAPDGAVFEVAPARTALMEEVAVRIASHDGAGLFFDYGHLEPDLGDTLQAVRAHEFAGILDTPGEADLTSHVDFSALAATAAQAGLAAHTMTQGDFLLAMGLLERAGHLGASGDATLRERLASEVERLAGQDKMGSLFKVLALSRPGRTVHPFGRAD
ncbi:class I SAM-dependent methyltransferase [Nitratireductor mangrovi]|uniref:Class I SAM-dependent methyltransferase n=1 Tax=Nitratireductor mangrovi TaxID=2599600 RepID=A0A5B8L3C3_9HYPH|nr:class I SAM-dependent methyltransferase [Nitratireductor mangrovi]QDZ02048.1 class I SAM-dependent methyltransferase [Nitratireductor mangrovi]